MDRLTSIPEFPVPDTLPGGMKFVYKQSPSNAEYCGVFIDVGSRDESEDEEGMAHFIEHTIFKSTLAHPASYVLNRMEQVGGELNAYTTKEETAVYTVFPRGYLVRATELLAELLSKAAFRDDELDNERQVVLDEIESYRDNPAEAVYDDFDEFFFSGNRLAHNILGSAKTIRTFDHDRCTNFYKRFYGAENMAFFYLGPSELPDVLDCAMKLEETVGRLESPTPPRKAPARHKAFDHIVEIGSHQAHTLLGAHIPKLGSKKRTAFTLLSNILGGPGMNSMLNVALREKNGLVYSVESSANFYTDCGLMTIYFGCDPEDTDRCRDLTMREINKLIKKQLSTSSIDAARRQFIGQATVGLDNFEQEALSIGRRCLRMLPRADIQTFIRNVEAITPADILDAAAMLSPDMISTLTLH